MAKIIMIDDQEDALVIAGKILTKEGHEFFPLTSGEKIIEEIKNKNADIVITDNYMPGVMGGAVYKMIRREIGQNLPVIISSSMGMKVTSHEDPLLKYCQKPVEKDCLLSTINNLLEQAKNL